MQVIVLFIPPHSSLEQLQDFARSGLGSRLAFWLKKKISHCDILDIEDPSRRSREAHGLISLPDPADAENLIQRLNGQEFNGKAVEVRHFFNRSPSDKRINQVMGGKHLFQDSRRQGLKMQRRSELNRPLPRPKFFKLQDTIEYDMRPAAKLPERNDED
ncbi:MAG: hypothetical protein HQL47_01285 [Gammaproteobacteria bacterium]|nr:hypothetical protein [Gammaproteobacteria bacterium]